MINYYSSNIEKLRCSKKINIFVKIDKKLLQKFIHLFIANSIYLLEESQCIDFSIGKFITNVSFNGDFDSIDLYQNNFFSTIGGQLGYFELGGHGCRSIPQSLNVEKSNILIGYTGNIVISNTEIKNLKLSKINLKYKYLDKKLKS